ncbi:MAG: hypothetical protein AAB863_02825 [Patescibacteria group bacterium]
MEILEDLWNAELNYKGVRVNFFGVPKFLLHDSKTVRSTLSRLSKKGFVKNTSYGKWMITPDGKKYFEKENKILRQFASPFKKGSVRNLLVMFDIPESRSTERHWFRAHLRKFNYKMIQKSVWVGPSPLPKEFVAYLKEVRLIDCIKQFKLAKDYKLKH